MTHHIKHIVILCLGWILVVAGIIGFFLPFLQGMFMLFIGLILLSFSSETVRTWIERFLVRHPRFVGSHKKIDSLIKRIFRIQS